MLALPIFHVVFRLVAGERKRKCGCVVRYAEAGRGIGEFDASRSTWLRTGKSSSVLHPNYISFLNHLHRGTVSVRGCDYERAIQSSRWPQSFIYNSIAPWRAVLTNITSQHILLYYWVISSWTNLPAAVTSVLISWTCKYFKKAIIARNSGYFV